MPDHELSDAQIAALLDYLAADGPAADERPRIRPASAATRDEIALGQRLFFGATRLASGGLACASCHSLSKLGRLGGSLAADLSDVYARVPRLCPRPQVEAGGLALEQASSSRSRSPCVRSCAR